MVKSVDGGGHWTTLRVTTGLFALDPARPSTLYATGRSPGFLPILFKSVDGGGRWASVTDSLAFEPFDIFSVLAVDPAVPSRLFLGTTGKGLWRSPDRGASWKLAVQGLPDGDRTDVAALAAAQKPHSGTVYLGAGSRGLFRSVNAGASWRKLRRTPFGAEVTRLAVSPRSPGTVYAVDAGGLCFRTQNGGAQWNRLSSGLRTADVAVAPSDARTVYASGFLTLTDLGGIARSTDAGARFRKVNEGLSGVEAFALAFDPRFTAFLVAPAAPARPRGSQHPVCRRPQLPGRLEERGTG